MKILNHLHPFLIKFFDSEKSIWEKVKSLQALADQATQLAHDIRSPLEVIKSIKGDLMNLPQAAQQRVMMGIGRIEEISRNLLSYYSNAEIVLIDDDKLIHLLWKIFFKNKNYKLTSYTDFEGFYQNAKLHHKDTWIVVDSKTGDFVRGEVESENVYKIGFKNICLLTGFVPEQVVTDYWIKKVIGKDPNEFIKFTE